MGIAFSFFLSFFPLYPTKLGETGDRFGDYLCVDCVDLPSVSVRNQFINTKFTRPIAKFSKSISVGAHIAHEFVLAELSSPTGLDNLGGCRDKRLLACC